MSENEHLLNVHVSKTAADSCADFLGYTTVTSTADVVDRRLTQGKWLVGTRALILCLRHEQPEHEHAAVVLLCPRRAVCSLDVCLAGPSTVQIRELA